MRYKIIITGPVGAGKTTAINSLTDQKALKTDAPVSDMTTSQRKQTTTVALDYGVIKLNENDVAHVYGTPGQERFDFMWEIISEGAHGMVLLLDNSRNYPFRDLIYYVNQFRDLIDSVPFIIGVTRSDVKAEPDLATYRSWAEELNLDAKVLLVDARNKVHIHGLLTQLLEKKSPVSEKTNTAEKIAKTDKHEQQATQSHSQAQPQDKMVRDDVYEEEGDVVAPVREVAAAVTTSKASKIQLTEKSMAAVSKINGVTGVSLSNDMGELIDSTIMDDDLNEFIAFLSGITPTIQDTAGLGEIHRIMLRGAGDDNLTVFVEDERSLGVTSSNKTSVPALSQQIEDMLQWI